MTFMQVITTPFYLYAGVYVVVLVFTVLLEIFRPSKPTWDGLGLAMFLVMGFPWFLCSVAGITISPLLGYITAILVTLHFKSNGAF